MLRQNGRNKTSLDEVGRWTEIKLDILRQYARAYALILKKQSFKSVGYIDGFAGAGSHIARRTGEEIEGSPRIALSCGGFSHYHFIDMDGGRAAMLRSLASGREDVDVHEGDCNAILLRELFPRYRYQDYRRALCLLDPYDLNPKWTVVREAGQMRSIDIFLNFMIMDANQNVFWKDPGKVRPSQAARMTEFWGDESWQNVAYAQEDGLFGPLDVKQSNDAIVEGYRRRLKDVAGFKYVPPPLPMRNSKGATVYYLFFASANETGHKIASSIFNKYRESDVRE